jgi:hypothetical protein
MSNEPKTRVGVLEFSIGYIVDIDDEEMKNDAVNALKDDIKALIENDNLESRVEVTKDDGFLSESNICDFLQQLKKEREEEQRRDEKRGLYPDEEDVAN